MGQRRSLSVRAGPGSRRYFNCCSHLFALRKGDITFNGQSLQDVAQRSIWRQASVVLQDNHFFFGTIRENLALAGTFSDETMRQVLDRVELDFALDEPGP